MKAIRRFTVRTVLPESLSGLEELAANLRWSWHQPTLDLFLDIAPDLWAEQGKDPIGLLGAVPAARLRELAADEAFVARVTGLLGDEACDERVRPVQPRVLAGRLEHAHHQQRDALAAVAPAYLREHGVPQHPADLPQHRPAL